jgi:hypothetical protein
VRQLKQNHSKEKNKILLREKGASSLALAAIKSSAAAALCTGTAAGCLLHFNWLNKHQLGAVALRTSD